MFNTDPPESVDQAQMEFAALQNWMNDLITRQNQIQDVQGRMAFLQGWLTASTPRLVPDEEEVPPPLGRDEEEVS